MDSQAEAGQPKRRSLLARLGIVALNLYQPGLGLIRLGRLRAGLAFLFGPAIVLLVLAAIAAIAPTATFHGVVVLVVLLIPAAIAFYLMPVILGWRWSRSIDAAPWWSRWYGLVTIWLIAYFASLLVVLLFHHKLYKPYYIPAEGMMPTLVQWDRILVDMSDRIPRRGEVIVFRTPDGDDYIKRVAALGGDTIEMRDGVPVINGMKVDQRPAGAMRIASELGGIARRLSEQLPGEQGRHDVLDFGDSDFDNTAPVKVPAGSFFVLGDNRDRSADSRVPLEMAGAGIPPVSAVRGRVLFITYSTKDWFSRSGTRINP